MTSSRHRVAQPDDAPPEVFGHRAEEHVIEGGNARISLSDLHEIWQYREVMMTFARRRVMIRYKQAVFGLAWAVFQPLLAALIFAAFLGRVAHIESEGAPYFAFALIGMVLWTYFSGLVATAMTAVTSDSFLLRKVYFPREILPVSAVFSSLFDLAPPMILALIVGGISRLPGLSWIALPLPVVVVSVFGLACGLFLCALNVYYRDVGYIVPFLLQVALFASPVAYPLSSVPSEWQMAYSILNPVAAAIDSLRRIVLHGAWPDWWVLGSTVVWSIFLLAISYLVFKRLERGFADRV